MSTLEQLIQETKGRWDRDFARLEGETNALERDINKTGERYGITDNGNTAKSPVSDNSDSSSQRGLQMHGLDTESAHKRAGERTEKVEGR